MYISPSVSSIGPSSLYMYFSLPYRRCADGFILLAALLTVASLGGSFAYATCGDWLAHPSHSMGAAADALENDPASDDDASAEPRADSNDRSQRTPCNGPECRSTPHHPLPPVPPTPVNASERLLLVGIITLHDASGRSSLVNSESAPHPLRGFPTDIEHPPRA